jgi:hypothetical protein
MPKVVKFDMICYWKIAKKNQRKKRKPIIILVACQSPAMLGFIIDFAQAYTTD